ncbi:phosphatidylserine decarboxylase protein [Rutstroemia sp. NJR-2017a BVV2]|nr:phosphatidylserine decarboxylase protein [Rutstroemia sp. NJR-2017a BVV2]
MWLITYIHHLLDYAFSFVKLVQNREVGWQTFIRKTSTYEREQMPIMKKLKMLLLFNPLVEWIDQTHLFRLWLHEKTVEAGNDEGTPMSAQQIRSFIDFYDVNMDDFEPSDPHAYKTFEDFFVRKHTAKSRPIFKQDDPSKAVVSADSRVVVYPTVAKTKELWIKGKTFTIENLILNEKKAMAWNDGAIASFRLSPQDYHRYHSPVSGTVTWFNQISGDYYQVDPICLRSKVDILTNNARCCLEIEAEEFGKVLFVAIGATDVGTVEINEKFRKPGSKIVKGEEVGLFQFGGSSIIVAFEKDRIKFDEDLLTMSRRKVMVDVEVGMSLGTALPACDCDAGSYV